MTFTQHQIYLLEVPKSAGVRGAGLLYSELRDIVTIWFQNIFITLQGNSLKPGSPATPAPRPLHHGLCPTLTAPACLLHYGFICSRHFPAGGVYRGLVTSDTHRLRNLNPLGDAVLGGEVWMA